MFVTMVSQLNMELLAGLATLVLAGDAQVDNRLHVTALPLLMSSVALRLLDRFVDGLVHTESDRTVFRTTVHNDLRVEHIARPLLLLIQNLVEGSWLESNLRILLGEFATDLSDGHARQLSLVVVVELLELVSDVVGFLHVADECTIGNVASRICRQKLFMKIGYVEFFAENQRVVQQPVDGLDLAPTPQSF